MRLVFATNLVHHHQIPLADEFYRLLGDEYHYIATERMPDFLIKGGYDPDIERPYIIRTYESDEAMRKARMLIDTSDIVIIGSAPNRWVLQRKKGNKITFHYSERWLKRGFRDYLSPFGWLSALRHHSRFRRKNCYMLCASAYTASDVRKYFSYPGKCFKWGYFTKVDDYAPDRYGAQDKMHIMWCARFLKWKHPELPVLLVARLKEEGYGFVLDMFGSGEKLGSARKLAESLNVLDVVNFCGNRPNDEILLEMQRHQIFLFTSDRNEGWGAVANEAMSNGCVLVGSGMIGAVPYLVKDGENGLVFRSASACSGFGKRLRVDEKALESLYGKVKCLFENPEKMRVLSENGVKTMREIWSPAGAAARFLKLAKCIAGGQLDGYKESEGPASRA